MAVASKWDSGSVRALMRAVEGWPRQDITFLDASPIYANAGAFDWVVDKVLHEVHTRRWNSGPTALLVAGLDARGFILGAAMVARSRGAMAFLPLRKKGKLPPVQGKMRSVAYQLEYGSAAFEVNEDDVAGRQCLIVDDLLATGGTMTAAAKILTEAGGTVSGAVALLELASLNGRDAVSSAGVLQCNEIFSLWLVEGLDSTD